MSKGLLRFIEHSRRKEIMRRHGITSDEQVRNVVRGICNNFPLLNDLIEEAEKNKRLIEKAREFEATS